MVITYLPDGSGGIIPIGGMQNTNPFELSGIGGFINGYYPGPPEEIAGLRVNESLDSVNGGIFVLRDINGDGFGTITGGSWDLDRVEYGGDNVLVQGPLYSMTPYQGTGSGEMNVDIPEPATLSLLALGGLGMFRRRKANLYDKVSD